MSSRLRSNTDDRTALFIQDLQNHSFLIQSVVHSDFETVISRSAVCRNCCHEFVEI
jgi:hypothetical protein